MIKNSKVFIVHITNDQQFELMEGRLKISMTCPNFHESGERRAS